MKETVVLKNHLTGEIREVEPTPELLSRLMGVEGFHQHKPPAAAPAEPLADEDSPEFIDGAAKAMAAVAESEGK